MCRVAFPEDGEGLVEASLFDETMGSEILAGRVSSDEVASFEEPLCAGIVAS